MNATFCTFVSFAEVQSFREANTNTETKNKHKTKSYMQQAIKQKSKQTQRVNTSVDQQKAGAIIEYIYSKKYFVEDR